MSGKQRLFERRMKKTETTTVTNSDCSQTVTTKISYYKTYCWKWANFNPCAWVLVENPAANCE